MGWTKIGTVDDLPPVLAQRLRARLTAARRGDVYDAAAGQMEPQLPAAVAPATPAVDLGKWKLWLGLLAGALVTIIVGALAWWLTRKTPKRRAAKPKAIAES